MSGTWCLNIHADWRCRHSGACCRAGWAIPVEGPQFEALTALRGREQRPEPLFLTGGPLPAGAAGILGRRSDGSCVFLDQRDRGLCEIHRDCGPQLLPTACRQFPRIVLRDGRGTLVTLSHYCPTAASLLLHGTAVRIVSAPPGISSDAVEGLDATCVLPPLVRPGLLADLNGYAEWERCGVDTLSRSHLTAWEAVETIARATCAVEKWSPSDGPLADAAGRAFAAVERVDQCLPDFRTVLARARLAASAVPVGLARPSMDDELEGGWPEARRLLQRDDRAVRAYLAARLFGNWIAYSAPGLRVVVEYLRVVLAVLEIEAARRQLSAVGPNELADNQHSSITQHSAFEIQHFVIDAIRQADLLLVHLGDHRRLAALISRK